MPPYLPVGLVQADGVHVAIRSAFKLAAKNRSDTRLRSAWDRFRAEGSDNIPALGLHGLDPSGGFALQVPVVGTEEDVAADVLRVGSAVLDFLVGAFGPGGGGQAR